jgi:hypothetical protein
LLSSPEYAGSKPAKAHSAMAPTRSVWLSSTDLATSAAVR